MRLLQLSDRTLTELGSWRLDHVCDAVPLLTAPLLAVFWLGLEWKVTGLVIGTLGGITDLLDGIVARKLKQVTELGALIDQLGDLLFESKIIYWPEPVRESVPKAFCAKDSAVLRSWQNQ